MNAEHGEQAYQTYQNPLLTPILAQLLADAPVHKLHELMQRLANQGCLPDWETTAEIQLFRTNNRKSYIYSIVHPKFFFTPSISNILCFGTIEFQLCHLFTNQMNKSPPCRLKM